MVHTAAKKFASAVGFTVKDLLHLRVKFPSVSPQGLAFSSTFYFE